LRKAHDSKLKRFNVIIVDSGPDFKGRTLAKRLSSTGIKCKYTLIQMISFLILHATKVFLPSTYILCNGALVAPIGSSMIACLAHKNNIPVVAVCETYKFADRVNLDQINNNE
jgi:translation initiation factor eIF-2B subunit delta